MPLGNAYPVRGSVPDVVRVQGVWTGGGGAADMTKAAADQNRGIVSVKYHASTGIYTVTFLDVGNQLVAAKADVFRPTTVAPVQGNVVRGSFSQSAKTVDVEFCDLATPSVIDLATTDTVG